MKRKIYLQHTPRQVARDTLLEHFSCESKREVMATTLALGRVTYEPIYAQMSMPHYHASAMDGIAVRARDTYEAHEQHPILLKKDKDFVYVDTGNSIPNEFDSVIMIEYIQEIDEDTIEIIEPSTPWQHIRPIGEDIVQGEMLFPQGHGLRPVDLGVLLASGITSVPVVKKPVVMVIPTGNELVNANGKHEKGTIIEFNGTVIGSYISEWGGEAILHSIVSDTQDDIRQALLQATETSDIVVINAGSSAGSKDYTVHVIQELGEVFTHGVATRPGKPVILGKINETIVIGIPGYPVSAYLATEWFVRPLVCKYLGVEEPEREKVMVKLGRRIVSVMGSEDFIRLSIGFVDGEYIANSLTRFAGVTMSLVRADGLLIIPHGVLGYEQGEYVEIELYKPLRQIKQAVLFTGSHDLTIDILGSEMKKRNAQSTILSSHTGSMAGIMAIKKGEAHVAGIHLLDPVTREYNISYVRRLLPHEDVVLYPFLKRSQGWIVPRDNPSEIATVEDIVNKDVNYVNRQKGAGTRVLFDFLLKEKGVSPKEVKGYTREMFSHLSVAAEVLNQGNSVGLGIYPVAKTMNLDFVPVSDESYDLLMTKEFYESNTGILLREVIHSVAFQKQVELIGGYEIVQQPTPIFIKNHE